MNQERRSEKRSIATFKSAYIEHNDRLRYVTLRDISTSGVCFSGLDNTLTEGDDIKFTIDDTGPRHGSVIWVKDDKFGVKSHEGNEFEAPRMVFRRPRSVRLPLSGEAKVFAGSQSLRTLLHNLSLRGTCVTNERNLRPGQLVSLEVGGNCFELATVKWVVEDRAGICFAQPLQALQFNHLLDRLQSANGIEAVNPQLEPGLTEVQQELFPTSNCPVNRHSMASA